MQAQDSRGRAATGQRALRLLFMKLRLYHHPDGARVAYREEGTGPPLALLHSAMLSHKELEPVVELALRPLPRGAPRPAAARRLRGPSPPPLHARLVRRGALPASAADVLGPRPLIGGHDAGAEILLRAVAHRAPAPGAARADAQPPAPACAAPVAAAGWRTVTRARRDPRRGSPADARRACCVFTPELGLRLSARREPAARDLMRHAFADVAGQLQPRALLGEVRRARWPRGPRARSCSTGYPRLRHAGAVAVGRQRPAVSACKRRRGARAAAQGAAAGARRARAF